MTNIEELEAQYREAVAGMQAVQHQLGAITRNDPGRENLKRELEGLVACVRDLKGIIKREGMTRTLAGLNSALHAACVARLDLGLVAELERDAMARQIEIEQKAAERRAAKAAAAPPTAPAAQAAPPEPLPPVAPPPTVAPLASPAQATRNKPMPEVIIMRRRAGGAPP